MSASGKVSVLVALGLFCAGCAAADGQPPRRDAAGGDNAPDEVRLSEAIEKLRPLHRRLEKPRPGDWLDRHKEPGQTFRQYLDCDPVTAKGKRRTIYIQPLGGLSEAQRKVVTLTADFMGRYFGLPVKVKKALPLSLVPKEARRVHPRWGVKQILTTYVLDRILRPRLPEDAAAYLAFTASDLWPGKGWNFVFGQASLRDRVGVWSIHRYGDPGGDEKSFLLCLRRTLKTACHETGHMFSMLHCTAYRCNMCGSNSLSESDRRPLWLCPECMAKVCRATGVEPLARYKSLLEFCRAHGLKTEADFYEKCVETLGGTTLFPISRDGKQGYIDGSGKVVIEPRFDRVGRFFQGLSRVLSGDRWGYIDKKGVFVIKPRFTKAWDFSGGFALVRVDWRYRFIDKRGERAFGRDFRAAGAFSEGLAPVQEGDRWGYINGKGEFVIKPRFDETYGFSEGLAGVRIGAKRGFIDRRGEFVIEPRFEDVGGFHDGLAPAKSGGRWGYIDRSGKFVIKPRFDEALEFCDGLAVVMLDGKWGCVDRRGKFVIEARFDGVGRFRGGRARARVGGRWGYIDRSGEFVIEPQFDAAWNFHDGLALVMIGEKVGYIDESGRFVWKPTR